MDASSKETDNPRSSFIYTLTTRLVLPVFIIAVGVTTAVVLNKTKPQSRMAPPIRIARLVETIKVSTTTHQITIEAMGLVEAKTLISLKARVSGEIQDTADNLIPGNTFEKGDLLYQIDPTDYELALAEQEANYQQSQASFMIEQGQQVIAREDYEMTDQTLSGLDLDLVLRKPQLIQAKATTARAKAQLDAATLDLNRTKVVSPFRALLVEKSESPGSIINTNTVLATLVECQEFWIELSVPVRDMKWIEERRQATNAPVRVHIYDELAWGKDVYRDGEVISLSNNVDANSKMAKVIVSIKDPLSLTPENAKKPKLMLGAFVQAEIEAKKLKDVLVLNRDYLRLNDTVWTLDANSRLVIHDVEIIYKGPENVIIRNGFEAGTTVVTSNLSVPVEGMLLRSEEQIEPEKHKKSLAEKREQAAQQR